MVTANFITETNATGTRQFSDIADAERFAMNVLGLDTVRGIVCQVIITDAVTGETTEFEY